MFSEEEDAVTLCEGNKLSRAASHVFAERSVDP